MRVLSIATSLTHGGAETVLVDLVLGLTGHEHCVAHSTAVRGRTPHLPFLRSLADAGVPCRDVALETFSDPRARRRFLADFRPDVVLFHWWGRDSLRTWVDDARSAGPDRRPSFVCVVHHNGTPAPRGYDHYVLVTRTQQPWVPPGAAVRIIPNGVDLARFRSPARRPRGDGRMVVGRVSRLSADKIPADWVRTAAAFGLPRTRFVIAGDGLLAPVLRDDVVRLGLEDDFELTGYVDRAHVPALLRRFDVFCHVTSTATESHPLALLEALAAGVPIVAEARGGVPEIVAHGVNGLLAASLGEIGDHLHALRRDQALRETLSRGARRTARRFSLTRQRTAYRLLLAQIDRERRAAGHGAAIVESQRQRPPAARPGQPEATASGAIGARRPVGRRRA